jgi:hypothetical protein
MFPRALIFEAVMSVYMELIGVFDRIWQGHLVEVVETLWDTSSLIHHGSLVRPSSDTHVL